MFRAQPSDLIHLSLPEIRMVAEARRTADPDAERVLNREQLMSRIQRLNPTASIAYLAGFDACSLRQYLDHLHIALGPRGADAVWRRQGDTPAIIVRNPRD